MIFMKDSQNKMIYSVAHNCIPVHFSEVDQTYVNFSVVTPNVLLIV